MRRVTLEVPHGHCSIAVFVVQRGEIAGCDARTATAEQQINDIARQLHVATGAELRLRSWTTINRWGEQDTTLVTVSLPALARPTNPT